MAAASLEEPAVNHPLKWAGPNCKGIMEAELSALIPGLRSEECGMEKHTGLLQQDYDGFDICITFYVKFCSKQAL